MGIAFGRGRISAVQPVCTGSFGFDASKLMILQSAHDVFSFCWTAQCYHPVKGTERLPELQLSRMPENLMARSMIV